MHVRVLFFGMLRDLVGKSDESVALPDGSRLGDLLGHYREQVPRMEKYLPSLAASINQEYASAE